MSPNHFSPCLLSNPYSSFLTISTLSRLSSVATFLPNQQFQSLCDILCIFIVIVGNGIHCSRQAIEEASVLLITVVRLIYICIIMNLLKKAITAVLLLSFVVFVAFFGRLPVLRYVLYDDIPGAYLSNDSGRLRLVYSTASYAIHCQQAFGSSMQLLQVGDWLRLFAE